MIRFDPQVDVMLTHQRLDRYLRWHLWATLITPILYGAPLWWMSDPRSLGVVIISVVSSGVALFARALLHRQHVAASIYVIGGQLLVLPLVFTLVHPLMYPAAALIPVLLVTIILPMVDQRSIQRVMCFSAVSMLLTVGIGLYGTTWLPLPFLPDRIIELFIIGSFILVIVLNFVLLWQYKHLLAQEHTRLEQMVTERTSDLIQAKETAEQANQAKSVFLAKVSHELRTPLSAILSYTAFLADPDRETLSPRGSRWLTHITTNGQHLLSRINDVLDLSKIELGQLHFQPEAAALRPLLVHVMDQAPVLVGPKPLSVRADLSNVLPPVWMDADRIQQVLLNLLDNAVKFTEHGHIGLTTTVADATVTVHVTDTGTGIPAADQQRIFLPFQQVSQTQTSGTGLGLAICQQIIELHGGTLTVDSTWGQGSTFSFTLARAMEAPMAQAVNGAPRLEEGDGTGQ